MPLPFLGQTITAAGLKGYEIHMGHTEFTRSADKHPFHIVARADKPCDIIEGAVCRDGHVFGTYIHGLFDHDQFRRDILNAVRLHKGLPALASNRNRYLEKQRAYDRLAAAVRANLDMDKVKEIMDEEAK
jgi:adenosylcobyric acid synthase